MAFTTITDKMKQVLTAGILAFFSEDILKRILEALDTLIREQTGKTENPIDDWIPEFLESIIQDDGKLKILCDFIRGKCSHICQGAPAKNLEYAQLADELAKPEEGECESLAALTNIIELLQVIVPMIIEWLKTREEK